MTYPVDISRLTPAGFADLPLVIQGESKEVRYAGQGYVVIRFKPTIYSFTHNRCAEVPGSEVPRLRASKRFVEVLAQSGIRHAYREVNDRWVLAQLVMPHKVEFDKYGIAPFVPPDLSAEDVARLPKAPPIEIVVKNALTGTTKHGCIGLAGSSVRGSHPFYAGQLLEPDGALPEMLVRFDWRNPLKSEDNLRHISKQVRVKEYAIRDIFRTVIFNEGRIRSITNAIESLYRRCDGEYVYDTIRKLVCGRGAVRTIANRMAQEVFGLDRVADVCLPDQIADFFIDVRRARQTAFLTAKAIEEFLSTCDIVFYDICLFIDESGTMVYGELSPDCGRYRHLDLGELDKDVWRTGGSSDDVIKKWLLLCELIGVEGGGQ